MRDLDALGERVLDGLATVRSRVLVRDRCGRPDVVDAVVGACRRRHLEAVVQHRSNAVLRHLLATSGPGDWTDEAMRRRNEFPGDVEALITLGGWPFDPAGLDEATVAAWASAIARGSAELDALGVVTIVVAVAGDDTAAALGTTVERLDAVVWPSILVDPAQLQGAVTRSARAVAAGGQQVLLTPGCRAVLDRGERPVLADDGVIDRDDIARGAVVSNLPAGSVYWTVVEHRTRGGVRLVDGTVLRFDGEGRVAEGPYRGERVSHVGVGVNPAVGDPLGWTIVDEHRPGAVFLALGENRYLGGENASTVNVDLLPGHPTLAVAGTVVVDDGVLAH